MSNGQRGFEATITAFYSDSCDLHEHSSPSQGEVPQAEGSDLFPWERFIKRAAKRIYDRKLVGGQIDLPLFEQQALALWKGTKTGFGAVEYGTPNHGLLLQYKYNVHVFAAFKNHHNTEAIANLLFDENGQIKPFSKFQKEALAISKDYNKRWLNTEYLLAVRRARTGNNLQKALENTDLYPNWEYIKSKAADPREDHKKYYGKVFSLTTTEGRSILPPNGYLCQCSWRVTDKELTDEKPDTSDIKEEFLEDPTNGRIFSEFHPYFEVQKEFEQWSKQNWNLDLPANPDKIKNIFKEWQRVTKSDNYVIEHKNKETGGFVARHKDHGDSELSDNLRAAKALADKNADAVVLQPIVIEQGVKNPDALVSGIIADFKAVEPNSKLINTINRRVAKARGQGAELVVITLPEKVDFDNLSNGIRRAFYNDRDGKITAITFIYKEKVVSIDRQAYLDNSIEHWVQKKLKN